MKASEVKKIIMSRPQHSGSVMEILCMALDLLEHQEAGRVVVLPLPIGATLYIGGDRDCPVEISDIGLFLDAGEEKLWYTLPEFNGDYKKEIEAAKAAEKGERGR